MPIVWTEEAKASLEPRTREELGDLKKPTLKTAWKKTGTRAGHQLRVIDSPKARELAGPERGRYMEAATKLIQRESIPDDLTLDGAIGLLALAREDFALSFVIEKIGLPVACEARIRALAYVTRWERVETKDAEGKVRVEQHGVLQEAKATESTTELRNPFLAASDEVRAECKQVFERLWPSATIGQKVSMAWTTREPAWTKEIAPLFQSPMPIELFYAMAADLDDVRRVAATRKTSRSYYEIVRSFGEDALPFLLEIYEKPLDEFDLWHCLRALALFDDVRAAERLAAHMKKVKVKPHAMEFFQRFPHHAETVLAPLTKGKTKLAELALEILESARRKSTPVGEEASEEELPEILRSPPWTQKKRPKLPTLAELPSMPPREEKVIVDRERARRAIEEAEAQQKGLPELPAARVEELKKEPATRTLDVLVIEKHRVPDDLALFLWTAKGNMYSYETDALAYMIGKFGERALDGAIHFLGAGYSYDGDSILQIDSPRMVLPLAKIAQRPLQENARRAWRWFRTFTDTTIFVLAPTILTTNEFDFIVRKLVREGANLDVLEPWGDEVVSKVRDWLAFDRRWIVPKKPPKMPPAFKPDTFTRPQLANGKRLPISAVETIATMLAISEPHDMYAGLEEVKAACEPRSLAEFAWDMAKAWENTGAKSSSAWMRDSLIAFADDEVVRRTTPAMKSENVIQALRHIATPAARMELATISARMEGNPQQRNVEGALEDIAADLGMTKEELDDALVPVVDVDAQCELELDFGPRKIRVGFDGTLEPYTVNDDGTRVRALPPARKTDDAEKVEVAKRIWSDLKEDVTALAQRRLRALEHAACSGRTWTEEGWRKAFLERPLALHIARGLVWSSGGRSFRIMEDGTFADENENKVELAGEVRLPHPIQMEAKAVARWLELLQDYEIIQPFPQLARTVRRIPEGKEDATELEIEIAPLKDHDALYERFPRWMKSNPMSRPLHATHGSVFIAWDRFPCSKVKLSFGRRRLRWPLSSVPPIDISEALHDLLD